MRRWFQNLVGFFSSSISKKIIFPYALLTLVLAALGVFVVVRLIAGSFEARLQNQLREAGQVVSDEIVNREEVRLEIERAVVSTIGVADALINRDTGALDALVGPIIANARVIDSIILVDTQGKELIRFHRQGSGPNSFVETQPNGGLDLSSWPAVSQVLSRSDGFKTVQLARDAETGQLIIYTVGPLRTTDGVVGATLVGTYLQNEIAMLQNVALAQLTLFDDKGRVMASTFPLARDELENVFSFFTPAHYEEIISRGDVTLLDQLSIQEQSEISLEIEEQGYRLAYAPFRLRNETKGVYAVALPTNFITNATDESRNVFIAIFSVGVALVFGIGYVIARRISQPILRLVNTSQAITGGDLEQRTGLDRDDEIGVLATNFDQMTARLREQIRFREEEASRLDAILTSIADGVVVLDLYGNSVKKNPAAEQMLAVMELSMLQDVLQEVDTALIVPADADDTSRSLLDYLSRLDFGGAYRFEAGSKMFSAIAAPVVNKEKVRMGTVVVLRDVTREYESEKLKDDFINSMSHELRTPLTAIKGYNELLKMTTANQLDKSQLEFIDTIGENVDDLLDIIQQMLDLSQIEAGNLGIDREPVDLIELVESEVENWTAKMEERELFFAAHIPSTTIWVEGDDSRLSQVMHNLIKNAHSYTLPGGRVEVTVSQLNGSVQVHVKDTGVGIAQEDQRFLFTRFFRAIHDEHTFEVSGAGLGLYTSKAIVEAHNGKMWMTSQIDQGSTFSFALPTLDPAELDLDQDE